MPSIARVVSMDALLNWKTQIRKGYLELCILGLIETRGKLYGFDILEKLRQLDLDVKEGTLYPLLNRMTKDKILKSFWETQGSKGHPRKFYSLTPYGVGVLQDMQLVYENMNKSYIKTKKVWEDEENGSRKNARELSSEIR